MHSGHGYTNFFMRVHRIDPPSPLKKGEHEFKVPLFKGDLGGSKSLQLHIKLVLVQ